MGPAPRTLRLTTIVLSPELLISLAANSPSVAHAVRATPTLVWNIAPVIVSDQSKWRAATHQATPEPAHARPSIVTDRLSERRGLGGRRFDLQVREVIHDVGRKAVAPWATFHAVKMPRTPSAMAGT